jgi:phage head maturation protease
MTIEARKAAEGVQRRSVELRASGDKFEISARAIKYGAISEPIGGRFLERIAPGAFAESLKRGDEIVCLYNHDQNEILGRTRTGALQIPYCGSERHHLPLQSFD